MVKVLLGLPRRDIGSGKHTWPLHARVTLERNIPQGTDKKPESYDLATLWH